VRSVRTASVWRTVSSWSAEVWSISIADVGCGVLVGEGSATGVAAGAARPRCSAASTATASQNGGPKARFARPERGWPGGRPQSSAAVCVPTLANVGPGTSWAGTTGDPAPCVVGGVIGMKTSRCVARSGVRVPAQTYWIYKKHTLIGTVAVANFLRDWFAVWCGCCCWWLACRTVFCCPSQGNEGTRGAGLRVWFWSGGCYWCLEC
jgi:hypothetical protein